MGWAFCGEDSKGREIGYGVPATCDHPGCEKRIDRGLAFACGGMHGSDEAYCEGYFCDQHLKGYVPNCWADDWGAVCEPCYALAPKCPVCGWPIDPHEACEDCGYTEEGAA